MVLNCNSNNEAQCHTVMKCYVLTLRKIQLRAYLFQVLRSIRDDL